MIIHLINEFDLFSWEVRWLIKHNISSNLQFVYFEYLKIKSDFCRFICKLYVKLCLKKNKTAQKSAVYSFAYFHFASRFVSHWTVENFHSTMFSITITTTLSQSIYRCYLIKLVLSIHITNPIESLATQPTISRHNFSRNWATQIKIHTRTHTHTTYRRNLWCRGPRHALSTNEIIPLHAQCNTRGARATCIYISTYTLIVRDARLTKTQTLVRST